MNEEMNHCTYKNNNNKFNLKRSCPRRSSQVESTDIPKPTHKVNEQLKCGTWKPINPAIRRIINKFVV